MIPSILNRQIRHGVADFVRTTFSITTPSMSSMVDELCVEPNRMFKGPFISLGLPFDIFGEAFSRESLITEQRQTPQAFLSGTYMDLKGSGFPEWKDRTKVYPGNYKSPDEYFALANKGLEISKPIDIIKDPVILEFLDLPESHRLVETELETALISKLKDFLLELGSGFAYVGRQKRLTLDGDHFYSDLVFYHIKLNCYVIMDLKTGKLTHGDLGQMLMYVNYYDREIKSDAENPTIGLILCTDKNETVVKYVLDEKKQQVFTSRYQYELPTVEELQRELRREIELVNADKIQKRK